MPEINAEFIQALNNSSVAVILAVVVIVILIVVIFPLLRNAHKQQQLLVEAFSKLEEGRQKTTQTHDENANTLVERILSLFEVQADTLKGIRDSFVELVPQVTRMGHDVSAVTQHVKEMDSTQAVIKATVTKIEKDLKLLEAHLIDIKALLQDDADSNIPTQSSSEKDNSV